MPKIKMVKCTLRSPGEGPITRFVPLREFQLWRYFMTHNHGKIVEGQEISIWVDAETYAERPPEQARPLEAVVRIDLQYWDVDLKTAKPVQRFFPLDEYATIRDIFLSHFPDTASPDGRTISRKRLSETKGYYINPRLPQPTTEI